MTFPSYWSTTTAGGEITTSRGFSLRVGYRPTSSRRALVEVYGLHAPQGSGAFSVAPQIDAVGVMATYLARPADRWINPYVAGGVGVWRQDAQTLPPCRPEDGCLREHPYPYQDVTALSAVLGVGTYVTVLPAIALRADATLYGPLAIGGDQGSPRPVLSVGVSVRL